MQRRVIPVHYMSDWKKVKRTWAERLFSRPWNPFRGHKLIWNSKVYMLDNGIIYVSQETYDRWEKLGILDELEALR